MGKLAERFGDALKSGVYRVADDAIPLRAAEEANARVFRYAAEHLEAQLPALRRELAEGAGSQTMVVMVYDAGSLQASGAALYVRSLERLAGIAELARAASRPLFAVLVDPPGSLRLPALYKEKPA